MWFKAEEGIDSLIAKGKLDKAAKLLRQKLDSEPGHPRLRQQLGDVLGRAGRKDQAINVLAPLVHQFAQQGFSTKAIAVVKKIQRLDPSRTDTDRLIAKVQNQVESVDSEAIPVVQAFNDSDVPIYVEYRPMPDPAAPAPAPKSASVPEATSKLDSDWLDKAASRSDFHWSSILAHLSFNELSGAIGRLNLLTKHAGSIIYGQGDPADSLYILATGFARVFDRDPGFPYRQTAVLEEGQFFGEEAFFDPEKGRRTTVTAAKDCELLELDLSTLHLILQNQHRVLDQLETVYRSRPWTVYEMAI